MMWNWLVSGLATGATLVLYDGSPFADDGRLLLDAIDREQISVRHQRKAPSHLKSRGWSLLKRTVYRALECFFNRVPLSHESFDYVAELKSDLLLA